MRGDGRLVIPVPVAEAFCIDDLVPVDDSYGEAGGMPIFQDPGKGSVKACKGIGVGLMVFLSVERGDEEECKTKEG